MADKSRRCDGYKNDLGLAFGDWSFSTKETLYGTALVDNLQPQSVDDGTIFNNDDTPATKSISRTEISVRTVAHMTTSSWKMSHELDIEITYTPRCPTRSTTRPGAQLRTPLKISKPKPSPSAGGRGSSAVERATPGEEVPGSIPTVAARSLQVGSVSV